MYEHHLNPSGYDLYEVANDSWVLHVKNGPIHSGTFKEVVRLAVSRLGFDLEEIDVAVQDMVQSGNNGAHFGMFRSFIFSFKKEWNHDQKAS